VYSVLVALFWNLPEFPYPVSYSSGPTNVYFLFRAFKETSCVLGPGLDLNSLHQLLVTIILDLGPVLDSRAIEQKKYRF
jgi:hypothetical protein